MPDVMEARIRVRKERLGDLIVDLPNYARLAGVDVVRELELTPVDTHKPGSKLGRPNLSPETIQQIKDLSAQGMAKERIAAQVGVSKNTAYRYAVGKTHKIRRRWKSLPDGVIDAIKSRLSQGHGVTLIATELNVSAASIYRIKRSLVNG